MDSFDLFDEHSPGSVRSTQLRSGGEDADEAPSAGGQAAPGRPGSHEARDEPDPPPDPLEPPEDAAQPLAGAGVNEDMATATYDRAWAAVGAAPPASFSAVPEDGSDASIMLRVRSGDESGFTFLVEKYRKPIIHFMYRMTSNQAVAEELAQEVFLRVYRSRESYRAEAKFTTWLYRIATNLGVNYARDHKHEKAAQNVYLDQPDSETGTTPDVADPRVTAEQNLLRTERLAGIKAQIDALPERQRSAVLMHKYQEMDYREIGTVLKLSESATKSLLFRAYQTLRERLKDYV